MSDDRERLLDMLEQIDLILRHVGSDRAALDDEVRQRTAAGWVYVLPRNRVSTSGQTVPGSGGQNAQAR